VVHDAVDADTRETEREQREEAEQPALEPARRKLLGQLLLHGRDRRDDRRRSHRAHDLAQRGGQGARVPAGAHDELRRDAAGLGGPLEDLRRGLPLQPLPAHVAHHADHGQETVVGAARVLPLEALAHQPAPSRAERTTARQQRRDALDLSLGPVPAPHRASRSPLRASASPRSLAAAA
jgi:hypothetical protein